MKQIGISLERPYLWVQEKFVQFGKSTKDAGLCPVEIPGQFFLTLPSISSETCVIFSSVIPGTDVFCDWLFLGYSCVSPDTAAKFPLSLKIAIFGEKSTVVKTDLFCVFKGILQCNENVVYFLMKK